MRFVTHVGFTTAVLVLTLSAPIVGAKEEKTGWALVPDILARVEPPTFPKRDFPIADFGGLGDGKTDCKPAFDRAIVACSKAGGGPASSYQPASGSSADQSA